MATTPGGPLEIFPAEIWEMILEHLEKEGSSRDVLYTSLACKEFQRILEPTKSEWMRLDGSILQFIFPYLKREELLACRRVCKNWQRGVDNFLDDSESVFWRRFKEESAIQEFLKARRQHKMKTPLALRSLSFVESGSRMNSGFWEKALVLLSLYGDQTWYLRVVPRLYDPQRFYEILRQALKFTPNLKRLEVDGSYEFFESNREDRSVRLKKLKEHLEDHPLPKIDSLKDLYVNACCYFPFVMCEKLISDINPENLKRLEMHYFEDEKDVSTIRKPLLSLTKLRVCVKSMDELENIFDGISPTAPLENLTIGFGLFLDQTNYDDMCKVINKFKWTLKTLVIDGKYYTDDYDDDDDDACMPSLSLSELDTPNLKSLKVEDIKIEVGSLPPSLENLDHQIYDRLSLDHPQMDFYRSIHDAGGLENLPIWDEMRNLKTMQVNVRLEDDEIDYDYDFFCTRKMHEGAVNRGQL